MTDPLAPSDSGPDAPTPAHRPEEYLAEVGFDELNLSPTILQALREKGYTHPTPVQAKAFAPAMAGKDLIVRSKTGTGKTTAFGLPILERLGDGEKGVRALILCPTRELALQVAAELQELGKYKGAHVVAIYGGASMHEQQQALEDGAQIVVGTPGRVFDHIRRKTLKLEGCRHVVLDEADEMLNQGFYEEVTRILDELPKNRQVLLFSATVPQDIEKLIARYTQNAETLLLSGDVFTVDHIKHVRYDVSDAFPKPRNLIYVLEMEEPEHAIIFCNTRDDTTLVTAVLNRNGFDADVLNGDLPQKERERVMAKVKRGEVAFMVATDIAARGIDISDLGFVINYSLPEDPAVYLHRVGRTGRIGKKGTALNLISGRELGTLSTLEKKYSIHFEKKPMPAPEEAMRMWTDRHVKEIREGAAGSIFEGMLPLAAQVRARPDADDLIAFMLKYFFTHHRMEKALASGQEQRIEAPRPAASSSSSHGSASSSGRGRERERGPRRESSSERDRPARSASSRSGESRPSEGRSSEGRSAEGESRPRKPREQDAEGTVRMWVNLGQSDQLDEAGVRTALEQAGAPAGKLTKLDVRPTYSYAWVLEADAAAMEAINGRAHGEKALKIERARRR